MDFSFDFGGEVTNLNGVLNDAEGDNLPCYDLSGRRTLFRQPSHRRQTPSPPTTRPTPPTTRHSERTTRHSVQSTCRAVLPGEQMHPSHSGHSGCSAVSGMFHRFGDVPPFREFPDNPKIPDEIFFLTLPAHNRSRLCRYGCLWAHQPPQPQLRSTILLTQPCLKSRICTPRSKAKKFCAV